MNKSENKTATLMVMRPAATRLRKMAESRGIKIYRAFDLLLVAWDLLTPQQQHDAYYQMVERSQSQRQPQPV